MTSSRNHSRLSVAAPGSSPQSVAGPGGTHKLVLRWSLAKSDEFQDGGRLTSRWGATAVTLAEVSPRLRGIRLDARTGGGHSGH